MVTIPDDVIAAAQAADTKWHVPASVTIAQWALESGWGQHQPDDNPFGIKAAPGQPFILETTNEFVNGHDVTIKAPFAAYDSIADAFDEHGRLLATNTVYAPCFAAPDAEGFASALTGRYATDPNYGTELCAIMREHDLTQYDAP